MGAEQQEGEEGKGEEGEEGEDDGAGDIGEEIGENEEVGSEPSPVDVADSSDVQVERLAYFLGGTPRRTREFGSPWSAPLASPVPPTQKPTPAPSSPKNLGEVNEALKKLE